MDLASSNAKNVPSNWTPLKGLGKAAADGGRDVWTPASTNMTVLLATSGALRWSRKYSSVVKALFGSRGNEDWVWKRRRELLRLDDDVGGWRRRVASCGTEAQRHVRNNDSNMRWMPLLYCNKV